MVETSEVEIASLGLLDHESVDWERVHRTAFLIHQHFRYEYPGPVEELNHRLVIVPPERHLDQRRVMYRLDISSETGEITACQDSFGNSVLQVYVPYVEESIDFEAWIVVERGSSRGMEIDGSRFLDLPFVVPSSRTEPDETLRGAARELLSHGLAGVELARSINLWVYERMHYEHDVTDIHTTAAQALALGRGVCQDYAHVMIALCRLCDLPARYISGHLLGEGGTHAWVEVLVPAEEPGRTLVYPFDPTHGCEPGLSYVTVAVGRDYGDVPPTSGTFRASYGGRLRARKQVGLTAVDYRKAG